MVKAIPFEPGDKARKHPDCCLYLSKSLVDAVWEDLPPEPKITLSIGSGSGLLEAILTAPGNKCIECVELETLREIDKYIAEKAMHYVSGMQSLCERAGHADAWLFVYPRDPALVSRYIERFGNGSVGKIFWLGPRQDWDDLVVKLAEQNHAAFHSPYQRHAVVGWEVYGVIEKRKDLLHLNRLIESL